MGKRFVSIWFRHLTTDWFSLHRSPETKGNTASAISLKDLPFVLRAPLHGRMVITAANAVAESKGIKAGMVLADARAIIPDLEVMDDKPELPQKLLSRIAEWCIRFSPIVAIDLPDGLLMDATGCPHLWGGEEHYTKDITNKLNARGYDVRVSIACTLGVAWAVARFGKDKLVIPAGLHIEAILPLPPESLRLEFETVERLHKLGLHQIRQLIPIPRTHLRRRFGQHFISRLNMATGEEIESIEPVQPMEPYHERLPCMEPIVTATGIEIAVLELLKKLCLRLQHEQKGLRTSLFKCYRVDGKISQVHIATNRPSHHVEHLFKLFENKIQSLDPGMGIDLFVLEASKVEDYLPYQEKMWEDAGGLSDVRLSELIDRLAVRIGFESIHRYVAAEHYWPERSFALGSSLRQKLITPWRNDKQRPIYLLQLPERIEVTAPIPDYPPMLFIHNGKLHKIVKADGPERIEQEWWIQHGQHRDYYRVEVEDGNRYWLFRSGHYHENNYQWFLHGYFS